MKFKISILVIFFTLTFYAQEKYYTKSGTIIFESSVATFEEVKATNTKVTAIFKPETGDIAALALVKAFRFKVALMEEHFNENYAESNKYPKAKFSGKIENFDPTTLNNTKVWIKGKLTFHGVTKEVRITADISNKNDMIQISSSFTLKPEEFGIEIPKIVRKKIAKEVDVSLNFSLKKK
jgi:polyisoprenoid-binding protein YceI